MNIFNLKIHQIIHLNNFKCKSNLVNYINTIKPYDKYSSP